MCLSQDSTDSLDIHCKIRAVNRKSTRVKMLCVVVSYLYVLNLAEQKFAMSKQAVTNVGDVFPQKSAGRSKLYLTKTSHCISKLSKQYLAIFRRVLRKVALTSSYAV